MKRSELRGIVVPSGTKALLAALYLFAATTGVLHGIGPAAWADELPSSPPESDGNAKLNELLEQLQQVGDTPAELRPSQQLDKTVANQRKSLALYMAGRSYEQEKKYQQAFEAYEQAIALDPTASAIYKAMIPLAFRLDNTEQAIVLAQKAVELDPDNFELLSQLGIYSLRNNNLQSSIEYFQKAVDSQTVDKKGGPYISIMSQLGELYVTIRDNERAAAAYALVFDAIMNSSEYSIDFRTLQALEKLRGTKADTFESFGELFLLTERLELAKTAFEAARDASRDNPAIFSYQLARVLNKQSQTDEALKMLEQYFTAKLDKKGRGPYLLLAELLVAGDREEEIVTRLEQLAKTDPDNEGLQIYLAERYVLAERLDDALKIFMQYQDSQANQGAIQLGLLQVYRKQQNAQKALEALTQAMLNGSDSKRLEAELELLAQDESLADEMIEIAQARDDEGDQRELFAQAYLLGKLSMQRKAYDAVIDFYQRAMDIRKERPILETLYQEQIRYFLVEEELDYCIEVIEAAIDDPVMSRSRTKLQENLISILATNGQTKRALEEVDKLLEADPDNLSWQYQQGLIHYLAKDWESAIKSFGPLLEKAMEQEQTEIESNVRTNLSRSLAYAGLVDEAIELLDHTIELYPDNLFWVYQKGWVYYLTRQADKAVETFEKLVAMEGDAENQALISQTKFTLSAAYVMQGDFDAGEQVLEKIYLNDPDNTSVCNDLGYLYADRGKKLEQAYEMIKKAIEAEPDNKAYLDSMGWVLFRLERYEEAKEYLEQAVEGSTEGDSVLWDHLGDVYHKLDDTEKAKSAWTTAVEQEQANPFPDQQLIDAIKQKLKQ